MTHALLRCDATPSGGVGHFVRVLAIAREARRAGWTVSLAGDVSSGLGRQLLAETSLEVVPVRGRDLSVLAAEHGAALVHVDDYGEGADARERLARAAVLLSSMEDGTYGRRPADIVVDSTLGAEAVPRPDDGSTVVLRGIRYAPMRDAVLAARARRAERAPRESIGRGLRCLVVAGGTDAVGAAAVLAAVCRRAEGIADLIVVAPRESWADVRAAAGAGTEWREPFPGLLDLAAESDVVLSAAGTTAWELACVGVPTVLVAVVDNQRAGYEAAVAQGFALGLGALEDIRSDVSTASAQLERLIARLPREDRPRGIDGRGAERVVAAWDQVLAKQGDGLGPNARLSARRAVEGDALPLLRWRNDPDVRAVSRSPDPVPWEAHRAWLKDVLVDPGRRLYVVEHGRTPVGTVRLDRLAGSEWEVSITLAPEARGRGVAGAALRSAETAFLHEVEGATLIAAILPDNIPSQSLFARAGFRHVPGRKDGDFDILLKGPTR